MSLNIPTTAELKEAIISRFESEFSQTIPLFTKAALRVISTVWAGVHTAIYKYGGSVFLQMFPQYASTETIYVNGRQLIPLVEWGRLVGVGDPTEATRAEYEINITVTNQTGTLPANTQLFNAANGVTYLTLADVALSAATVQADIRAASDQDDNGGRGTVGNLSVSDIVSFVNPLPNVAKDAVVATENVTGADAESWEAYRARVVDRFRKQPQGGAYVDYEFWAEEVEGIINAYVYTGDPGQVDVYSEATVASSGSADGIPTAAQLTAVLDNIELNDAGLATRRPANAFVNSLPISRTAFDIEVYNISQTVDFDVPSLEAAIEEALVQYFLGREPYVPGGSLGKRRSWISNAEIAGVVNDVCVTYNTAFETLTVEETGESPFAIYSLDDGEKAKLGTVTFIYPS